MLLTTLIVLIIGFGIQAKSFEVPALTEPVIDSVGLLNATTKKQLEKSLYRIKKENNIQLQIYVTKSLQGENIESVAIQIFDKWKLGDSISDKGLLFLIAPNEKRLRIEVGQGLEGEIPDVIAKRIISEVVVPYFKRNEFNSGVLHGVVSIENYVGNSDVKIESDRPIAIAHRIPDSNSDLDWIFFFVVAVVFFFLPIILPGILNFLGIVVKKQLVDKFNNNPREISSNEEIFFSRAEILSREGKFSREGKRGDWNDDGTAVGTEIIEGEVLGKHHRGANLNPKYNVGNSGAGGGSGWSGGGGASSGSGASGGW